MSNTNSNFEMTGILLGQEVCKRKTPQDNIAIIQQTMDPGMNVSHVAACMVSVTGSFKPSGLFPPALQK